MLQLGRKRRISCLWERFDDWRIGISVDWRSGRPRHWRQKRQQPGGAKGLQFSTNRHFHFHFFRWRKESRIKEKKNSRSEISRERIKNCLNEENLYKFGHAKTLMRLLHHHPLVTHSSPPSPPSVNPSTSSCPTRHPLPLPIFYPLTISEVANTRFCVFEKSALPTDRRSGRRIDPIIRGRI